jgi:hypothetical protein
MNRKCDTIDIRKGGIGKHNLQIASIQLSIFEENYTISVIKKDIFFGVRKHPTG